MSFISDFFSGGASTLVDSIGGVISKIHTTTGEKMTLDNEIKKAEFEYNSKMAEIGLETEKVELADTDSARKMNSDIENSVNASWLSKNIVPLMAIFITLLCFTIFFLIIGAYLRHYKFDPEAKDIIMFLLGGLFSLVVTIVGFYFGSSHGSFQKNAIFNKLNSN